MPSSKVVQTVIVIVVAVALAVIGFLAHFSQAIIAAHGG